MISSSTPTTDHVAATIAQGKKLTHKVMEGTGYGCDRVQQVALDATGITYLMQGMGCANGIISSTQVS